MFEALVTPSSTPVAPSHLSVKLPASLVSAAKESAQTFRRSTAGQIEYWAALGRKVESSGLTMSQAEQALKSETEHDNNLDAQLAKMQAAHASGSLNAQFHKIIQSNQALAG